MNFNRFFQVAGMFACGLAVLVVLWFAGLGMYHAASCGCGSCGCPQRVAAAPPAVAQAAVTAAPAPQPAAPAVVQTALPESSALAPEPSQNRGCIFGCIATSHVQVGAAAAAAVVPVTYSPEDKYVKEWGEGGAPPPHH
jgi:hypothetical protein